MNSEGVECVYIRGNLQALLEIAGIVHRHFSLTIEMAKQDIRGRFAMRAKQWEAFGLYDASYFSHVYISFCVHNCFQAEGWWNIGYAKRLPNLSFGWFDSLDGGRIKNLWPKASV